MRRTLSYNPITGIHEVFYHDEGTGISGFRTEQNVDGLMDANKREYNADHGKWGEFRKVGSIPMTLYHEWKRQGILKDQKALAQKLNDPDFLNFRTRPCRI